MAGQNTFPQLVSEGKLPNRSPKTTVNSSGLYNESIFIPDTHKLLF